MMKIRGTILLHEILVRKFPFSNLPFLVVLVPLAGSGQIGGSSGELHIQRALGL